MLDIIRNDVDMAFFLQREIFRKGDTSPVKIWFDNTCNIKSSRRGAQRLFTLQIRKQNNERISDIIIDQFPNQENLQKVFSLQNEDTSTSCQKSKKRCVSEVVNYIVESPDSNPAF
jgi:hypothetical protein